MLCEATRPRLAHSHPLLFFLNLNIVVVKSTSWTRVAALSLRVEGKNGIKRYDITTEQTGFFTFYFSLPTDKSLHLKAHTRQSQ